MEEALEKAMGLFKARKFEESLEIVLEIEKMNDLKANQKKKISDIKIRSLINLGEFIKAKNIFNQAIEKHLNDKNWGKVLENLILKIRILSGEEKLKEILEVVNQGETYLGKISEFTEELIESKGWLLYWKGFTAFRLYKRTEAIEYLITALNFSEENSLHDVKGLTQHWLGNCYAVLGEYNLSLKYKEEALQFFKEKGDEFNVASLLFNMGVTFGEMGEYKKAREYYKKRIEIFGEFPLGIAYIGDTYWREGELEKALEYTYRGLEKISGHFKNIDKNDIVAFVLGNLHNRIGNKDEALKFYKKTIDIASLLPRLGVLGLSHIGIANVYYFRGELEIAIEHATEALRIFESIERKYGLGWAHFSLMKIYHEKNDFENALLHGQICLDLRMAMGNKQDIAQTLRFLITFLLEKESYDKSDSYLKQLEDLALTTDNRIVKHNYQLSKALILKSKGRPKYWTKAIDVLEEIVSEPIATYETTLVALISLCEILLHEYSISGDEEVLVDLQTHTSRLLDIAQKQNSYTLRVESYHIRIISLWLQGQHSKLEVNIQNARRLLHEARDLADSHGLLKLASKITTQYDGMLEKLENWDGFIRKYYEFIKN